MKRMLLGILAVAVAISFASMALAEETATVKTKTKETATGTVTKEKGKVATEEVAADFKTKTITNGKFTTEKGKVVITPHSGDVKVEKVKFKMYNENDPSKDSDNTVLIEKSKTEATRPLSKDIKANHLEKLNGKTVYIYSTYNPLKEGGEVAWVEEATE